jgi:hypothetical protein
VLHDEQIANVPGAAAGTYVNDPTKFYSDNANGCKSAQDPNINSINQIFQSIGFSLSTARLLPPSALETRHQTGANSDDAVTSGGTPTSWLSRVHPGKPKLP